jgi:diguanylate cyclase (GGDEF)-like protein
MHDALYMCRISDLVAVCVSFYIIIFAAGLSKGNILIKYEGFAFLVSISFAVVSILGDNYSAMPYLIISSELVSLFILFTGYLRKKLINLKLYVSIIIISIIIVYFSNFAAYLYIKQTPNIIINLIIISAALLLKSIYKTDNCLKTSALIISSAGIIVLYLTKGKNPLYLLLSISGNICYLIYFYEVISSALVKKIDDVEKKITTLEKQLNYEVKKRTLEIEMANERLVSASKCDSLTGIYNKKAILFEAEKMILTKPNSPFCVLIFDIDNFKKINDTYGHVEGDNCILKAVDLVRSCLRENEKIGRYGGDEFVVVLPNTNLQQGINIAERIRKKIMDSSNPYFTVSIGITCYPEDGNNIKDLIITADKGLYKSKHYGRNYVSHVKYL